MALASPFPANHGTPGSIREMAQVIADRGHSVHIVAYHFGDGEIPPGIKVHRTPDLGLGRKVTVGPTWTKPLQDLQMVFTLCRVIWREKIDLIHAHNYEGALVGYLGSLITGRPLLYNAVNTMRDELASYGFFRPRILAVWLAKLLDYWVPRLPHTTVAISEDLGRFLREQGIRPERLHVIPIGIDLKIFEGVDVTAARERVGRDGRPLLIYTGCLDGLQRIDYLLQAMTVVVERLPEARLILLANAVKERDLEKYNGLAESLGIRRNVEIVCSDTFADVPVYLAGADVAVVSRPSCPGFPVKLLNYLAAGKPVVVAEGSAKGLKHGENALLAPDHDWRALGQGMLTLLSDPSLAARLARNGRQWVTDYYSWPVLTERMIGVYRQLVPSSTPAAESASS